jgi:hypothetical protein
MNHLTAWAILVTAFSSGLYPIYKFVRAKYVSYDTTPIHYWSNKKQRVKKRYKIFRNKKRKSLTKAKINSYYSYGKKAHYKTRTN